MTVFYGGAGPDTVYGGDDDLLYGGGGDDHLYGGAGNDGDDETNDLLDGGPGADFMAGGAGSDTYFVDNSGDIVMEDDVSADEIFPGWDVVYVSLSSWTAPFSIEQIVYTGPAGVGATLTGSPDNNQIIGGSGADTLYGVNGGDQLFGYQGADVLYGGHGSDALHGGEGNDILVPGYANDEAYGDEGNDVIDAIDLNTFPYGYSYEHPTNGYIDQFGPYVDTNRWSHSGRDYVYGGDGDDLLKGDGNDSLFGDAGNDTYEIRYSQYDLTGQYLYYAWYWTSVSEAANAGIDTVKVGAPSDSPYVLTANVENALVSSGPVTGNGLDNVMTATGPYAVTLSGMAGADTLTGGAGNDTLDGGAGADTLYGGSGTDTAVFSGARSAYTIGYVDGLLQVSGPDGTDTLQGVEKLKFSDMTIDASSPGPAPITGTNGPDTLTGTSGDDAIYGLDGADVLQGLAGADLLDGGTGADTASYAAATAGVKVWLTLSGAQDTLGAGTDTLVSIENLTGSAYADNLKGDTGANVLTGGDGADVLDGGGGVLDTYYGGAGADSINDWSNGTVYGGADADNITGTGVVYGDGGDDHVLTYGGNVIYGGDGNDVLYESEGGPEMYGGAGNDLLDGGASGGGLFDGGDGDDVIQHYYIAYGGDGDDIFQYAQNGPYAEVYGGAGNDSVLAADDWFSLATVYGGDGADYLAIGEGDMAYGGEGDDTIYAYSGSGGPAYIGVDGGAGYDVLDLYYDGPDVMANVVSGAAGIEVFHITTGDWDDTISGGAFGDILTSGAGNDVLYGGGGDDVLEGGAGNDILNGAAGLDTASYASATAGVAVSLLLTTAQNTVGAGTDTLTNIENLLGSAFNDTLTGNAAANVIEGGAGNDTIDGGAGIDTASYVHATSGVTVNLGLTTAQAVGGGQGSDTLKNVENLTGSLFDDVLIGSALANTLSGLAGADVLRGGLGNDILDGGAGIDTASYVDATSKVTVSLLLGAQSTGGGGTDTLISIENLTGSNFDDTLAGNYGDNVINGGAGSDTVSYLGINPVYPNWLTVRLALTGPQDTRAAGVDTLIGIENIIGTTQGDILGGDSGANILDGSSGEDYATYIDATAGVTVSLAITTAQNTVGAGFDTLKAIEDLIGSNFNDVLTGNTGANQLLGGEGDDKLYGGAGNDSLQGGAGADLLDGGLGNDNYYITDWLDTVVEAAGGGTDTVMTALNGYVLAANIENLNSNSSTGLTASGNTLANIFYGNLGADTFYGLAGDDKLYGNFGQDRLYGGEGNDNLYGESDDDILYGGLGNDVFWVTDAGDVAIEGVGEGTDTVNASVAAYTLGDNIEVLTYVVIPGWPTLNFTGTGNALANTLNGGAGDDTLSGLVGDDKLFGGAGADGLYGGDGNDILDGGAGTDSFYGGLGNDTFMVADAGETVVEALNGGTDTVKTALAAYALADNVENLTYTGTGAFAGTGNALANVIIGGVGGDTLSGLGGDDKLTGGAAADSLTGGEGNDTLDGGLGADTLDGGLGNDTYMVDDAGDTVVEALNGGTDTVRTTLAAYALTDNVEALTYTGAAAFTGTGNALANTLTGGAYNDVLYGGDGADRLAGANGDDVLNGGGGGDTLTGGAGADAFVFTAAGDTLAATPDTISDFSAAQGDYLDLSGIDADSLTAGDQGFTFLGTGAFTKHAGELRYQVSGVTTTVYGDVNGDGVADFAIRLSNTTTLTGADFHP